MTDIIFEPLPDTKGRGGRPTKHAAIAVTLQEHPGQWARIHVAKTRSSADSIAHQINVGILKSYCPPRTFEAKARSVDGEFRVYARYVGAGGETE